MKRSSMFFAALALLVSLFHSGFLRAQDTLYKENGSVQIVTIIDINETQVRYSQLPDTIGRTMVIHKNDIKKIARADGTEVTFPKIASKTESPFIRVDPRETDFGRNLISLTITDLSVLCLTLNHEHISKSGYFGLKSSFSVGLAGLIGLDDLEDYPITYLSRGYPKRLNIGFDFNCYVRGQGKIRYYGGPGIELGILHYYNDFQGVYFAFLVQHGVLFQPSKHFNVSIGGAMGFCIADDEYYGLIGFAYRWGLILGYKL